MSDAPILVSIVGTRPEAIKMAPVALAARRLGIDHHLIATGQHDRLFDDALASFGLTADRALALPRPGDDIDALATRIIDAIPAIVAEIQPDMLLVQGDTTSAWAAARGAVACGIAVGHVEAGLRSHDMALPWPEERNRVEIDRIATLRFAPSAAALANLAAEGLTEGASVTGNTAIDALLWMRDRATPPPSGNRRILVTCHRRENIGEGIARIGEAVRRIAARGDVAITLPVHPNPAVTAGVRQALGGVAGVELVAPLPFDAMVAQLAGAHLVLSDSGGLQEEAPALGVPLLVLRDNSERPEALEAGGVRLVGTDPDLIVAEATRLLDDPAHRAAMSRPAFPYGRGDAAERILAAISDWHEGRAVPR